MSAIGASSSVDPRGAVDDHVELVAGLALADDHLALGHVHRVRERGDALQLVVGALREQPPAAQQRDAVGESRVSH